MFSSSQVRPENSDIIADHPSKRPEHLILMKPDKTANFKNETADLGA